MATPTAQAPRPRQAPASRIGVQFRYLTGLKRDIFRNVRLLGTWDDQGRAAEAWTAVPMEREIGEDGCPGFRAFVPFAPDQAGATFRWRVVLDGPGGNDLEGITTEVGDPGSRERYASFTLRNPGASPLQEETYCLTHCRRLGAQKVYRDGRAGIRFSVWAPNAQDVQVVFGAIWDADDHARTPSDRPIPTGRVAGGYILNDGIGTRPHLGPLPMTRRDDGTWTTDDLSPELADFAAFDHKPYMFRIRKDDGTIAYRTDLYSRCQIGWGKNTPGNAGWTGRTCDLDGTFSCSVVIDPDTVTRGFRETQVVDGQDVEIFPEQHFIPEEEFWRDEFDPARPVPRRVEDLVIYELHLGALGFTTPAPGEDREAARSRPADLQDAINLLDDLVDLGVNAIELLPMSEFGGDDANWGYASSHYFAIEFSGGGRDKYKYFVRECHRRGIAVIMDVVYNHFVHNAERAEWMYDTNSHEKNPYYWYEGKPSDHREYEQAAADPERENPLARGHGGYLDNDSTAYAPDYRREMVRKLFISSAAALVEEFHVDGFRVDQTTSIHSYNTLHADACFGRKPRVSTANAFGCKLLREWTTTLKAIRPDVMLMAEDHSNWPGVTESPETGGLGFDAAWYADFYHHLIGDTDKGSDYAKLIKTAGLGDDRALALGRFAVALRQTGGHRVVYNESHDEAGNGKFTARTLRVAVNGAPLVGDTRRAAEARCRFAFGLTALSAGTPMFLFGEEVGAQRPFKYNSVLPNREDLNELRRTTGKSLFAFYSDLIKLRLRSPGLRSRSIDVLRTDDGSRVIAFRRWGGGQEFLVLASLNNRPFDRGYVVEHADIAGDSWREVFNSDARAYGGDDVGNYGRDVPSQPGRFEAVIPANGFVVFQRT